MTSNRAQAYGRVVATIEDLGPSKLQAAEQERIREAADALFFCERLEADDAARNALTDIEALARHLVESGRWEQARADQLADDIAGCGPLAPVL